MIKVERVLFGGYESGATGLGTASVEDIGTSGATVGLLNGNNDHSGIDTYSGKPLFLGHIAGATVSNVTGNGTIYTILFNEIFDHGGDYNPATGIFTAPVTGEYRFSWRARAFGFTAALTSMGIKLVTSARDFQILDGQPSLSGHNEISFSDSTLVDMVIGDTARVTIQGAGEASDVVDISGAGRTSFSGELVG